MRTSPIRVIASLALALALVLPIAACGDKGSSSGGGSASSGPGGASSPQDMVAQMQKMAEKEDIAAIVPLVLPEQRAFLTMMLGVFPNTMMLGMAEAFSSMAGAGGPDAKKEAEDKIGNWKKGWEALLAKHKIELPADDSGPDMMSLNTAKTDEERKAVLAEIDKFLGHVDAGAFIKESWELMGKYSDKKSEGMTGDIYKKFEMKDVDIKVDGDKATLKVPGEKDDLVLVKHDGRWYVDLIQSM